MSINSVMKEIKAIKEKATTMWIYVSRNKQKTIVIKNNMKKQT